DCRRGPHPMRPYPGHGLPCLFEKDDVDLVVDGERDDIRGKLNRGGDQDALHLLGRHNKLVRAGSYHKPIPLFPQARPECIDYQLHVMPRPLKPPARGLLSQTSSEHHVELYLKPDSTSESGYIDWIHAILLLRFCSVKRLCANAQHPAVAHPIRVHPRASAALPRSVLAGAALSSIPAATPKERRGADRHCAGRPVGKSSDPVSIATVI